MKRFFVFFLCAAALLGCDKNEGATGARDKEDSGGGGGSSSGITVSGTVKGDDGTLLEGVVVSDGINCVKTDSKGKFALAADLTKSDHVFVSTPSKWSAPVVQGQATFWKVIKQCPKGSDGVYTADFTLNKITDPEHFTIFIYADPQPRKNSGSTDKLAYKSLECCEDMYDDMVEQKALITGRTVYGIGLGDIVHQDLSLLDDHKKGIARTGISNYNIIGNHDQAHVLEQPDELASKTFESKMGPVNYSFNLGGMHFLMLDNMISPGPGSGKYSDECLTGLRDDIWQFVQNDLALVPRDTPVMLCGHSPMMHLESGKDRSGNHLDELRTLLKRYPKTYAWAGHTHATFNYAPNSEKIETHTVTRVTGSLWTNEFLGSNGTPRGYVIFKYDSGSINWYFHPIPYQKGKHQRTSKPDYSYRDWDYDATGVAIMKDSGKKLDDKYQMQLFKPGVYENNYVYANVFLWDEQWDTPKLDGATMSRVTKTDFHYSFAEWDMTSFYYKIAPTWYSEPNKNNCSSIFRGFTEKKSGTVKVTVTDRFGNNYESTLSL